MRAVGVGTELTGREEEVLELISRHLSNVQIAEELCISVRTVESHVSALLRKLQLPDRRSLARHHVANAGARLRGEGGRMPTAATPFVGRAAERAALAAALAEHRMVTATGPGGVGKTRLAMSVAADVAAGRSHGAWFVDLVQVVDPTMVIPAVADAVGAPEHRAASAEAALVASLAGRDALLVLDNCEHLLDGVRDCIERILAGCPSITVLATSRSRLLAAYEWVYTLPGLSITDDGGDAVDLFVSRVTAAIGSAEHLDRRRVAAVCRGLDGIALAIELAAARYASLGLDGLEAGLDERLRLLTAGGPATDRHHSLRAAIGWSHDLLAPDDQALLRRISMFASWFDVDAARTVAGPDRPRTAVADGLARLADHSLLVVDRGEPTRYRALETIRQYGVEQLERVGELHALRTRHDQWCREAIVALSAGEPDDAWCVRFDRVVDDARAALLWAAADERQRDRAALLAADLARLLFVRGRPTEAQRRYEQAASLAPSPADRADHLRLAAGAAATRHVGNDALRLLRAAADTAIDLGDPVSAAVDVAWMALYIDRAPGIMAEKSTPEEGIALCEEARLLSDGSARAEAAIAVAATMFANSAGEPYDRDENHSALLESTRHAIDLARQAGDGALESAGLDELTALYMALDDIPAAITVARQREQLIRTLPVIASNGFEFGDCLLMAAEVTLAGGDLVAAGQHADALARLPFFRDEDHLALSRRLKVDAWAGNFIDVVRNAERFRLGWERAGRPTARNLARSAYAAAMVHGVLGDDERRSEWIRIAVELGVSREELAGCSTAWAPTFDSLVALHHHDADAAVRRLSSDLDDPRVWGYWHTGLWRPWYAALWVEAAVLAEHPDAAARIERSRHATRANPIAVAIVERAAAVQHRDHAALERWACTFAELGCPYQQARTDTILATLG